MVKNIGHIETLRQIDFLKRNNDLKEKASYLLKVLIAFYEKNKDIKLELNENKDDLKYSIPEIINIKLNLLIDEKTNSNIQ